jgi:hypothetical protein
VGSQNAGKGCFADTGSTDLKFRQCAFVGSDRGLILDQSELTDVIGCDFEAVTSQTSLIWIVSGPDRNLGASQGFSNRISIQQCQIDGNATTIGIVDDGGAVHNFADNNYNGCLNHIRAAGVGGLSIRGGEFEGAAGSCVNLYSTTLAGAVSGACSPVLFDNSIMSPTASQHCITCFAAGQITLVGPFFGSTTATKLNGTGNISSVIALGVHNGGGGANFDGFATNHFEVDHSAAAISTNMPLQSTAAVGYVAGAGGTATQATSKSTGVPLNKLSGEITMNAAALAAGAIVSFTLTNSQIAAGDRIILNHVSGGTLGAYALNASAGAGSAAIHVRNATARHYFAPCQASSLNFARLSRRGHSSHAARASRAFKAEAAWMLTVLRIANTVIWAALLAYMFKGAKAAVTGKGVRRADPMRLGISSVCLVMLLGNLRWLLAPDSDALFATVYVLNGIVGIYIIVLGYAYGRGPKL